ncbi:SPOSA6832_03268 [Sporobolomyces salmonicolor]|uniref:SPOSA6832_03268-mRNA-1:cds n=1 Tax=Sporidiobolus salmonicolor TaxID=5005 RepID=A0A0D6EP16_SPOSA|nr:SPOSA6832_03268 [Sporobolomyces salmonicolor]
MAESICQLGQYVAAHTAVLPALLGFSMGARNSLKTYLAVQALPDAPKLEEGELKKFTRKKKAVHALVIAGLVGTEGYLLINGSEAILDIFFRYLFAFVYQSALMGTLFDLTHAFKWSVFRSAGRSLHFCPAAGTVSKPRVLTALAIATALNFAAYYNVHSTFTQFLTIALLYRTLSQAHGRTTFSLRVMLLGMIAWLALTFILSGIVIAAVVKFYGEVEGTFAESGEEAAVEIEDIEYTGFASPAVMGYINLMMPFVFSCGPGVLIAGCFRFDYANANADSPDAFAAPALETVDAPVKRSSRFARFFSRGVVFPTTLTSRFFKPYYTTALWSWLLAQLATFGIFALALPLPAEALSTSAFDLLGLALAIPFLVVGLAITASIRGEFRRLWTYKEVWCPTVDDAAAAEEPDVEEQVPAYSDAVDVSAEKKDALWVDVPEVAIVEEEVAPAYVEIAEPKA